MAELWDEFIKPVQATGFAREIIDDQEASATALTDLFPQERVYAPTYEWAVNAASNKEIASYRSYNAESPIIGGGEYETKSAKLAPLSVKEPFLEYERIRRMAQNSPETVQQAFNRLNADVTGAMSRRVLLARVEALVTGKLAIHERGLIQNVDFERREDFTRSLGTFWDAGTSADPVEDLEKMVSDFAEENGGQPARMITSQKVISNLMRSSELRAYLGDNSPRLLSREAIQAIFASYGLPAPQIVDDHVTYKDPVSGAKVSKRLFPEDRIVLTNTDVGVTVWGLTAESGEAEYGLDGDLPGMVVGAWKTRDPLTYWIHANATVLPVLRDANATMSVKVLGDSGN